jgi:CO/xanthine dehydrogenase Mo-binding subunit
VDMGRGVVVNANLENYLVPTVLDIPEIVNVRVDLPDPVANPTGAKGIGEPPLVPTAPAIANAVYDAIGVRIRQTPLSRQRVLTALAEQRANSAAQSSTVPPLPHTGEGVRGRGMPR